VIKEVEKIVEVPVYFEKNEIPDEEYFEREDLLELQEKKDMVELEKNLEIHEEPQVHIEPKRLSYSNRNGKSLRINRI